jgi:hypothetical protein
MPKPTQDQILDSAKVTRITAKIAALRDLIAVWVTVPQRIDDTDLQESVQLLVADLRADIEAGPTPPLQPGGVF